MGTVFDKAGGVRPGVLAQHQFGALIGAVRHACPECPLGQPSPFCTVCLGAGDVSSERLDRYQLIAARGLIL